MRKSSNKIKTRGITLIALVVTIVVLLILAGVSISMLTGENWIITQANNAKIETRGGEVEERVDLWKADNNTSNYTDIEVDTEDQMLQKLIDEKLVYENEIDREAKIIRIGSRKINYNIGESTYVPMEPDKGKEELILEYVVEAGDVVGLPYDIKCYDSERNETTAVFDFEVDWGDGSKDNITNSDIESKSKHTYTVAGTYEIKIKGTYEVLVSDIYDEVNSTYICWKYK